MAFYSIPVPFLKMLVSTFWFYILYGISFRIVAPEMFINWFVSFPLSTMKCANESYLYNLYATYIFSIIGVYHFKKMTISNPIVL